MPKKSRVPSPTGIYHVMNRGVNRQTIFENAEDKLHFLQILSRYKKSCNFQVLSYCLMDNHVHLLLREKDEPISNCMHRINTCFAYWYNEKYERCGHLFQGPHRREVISNYAQLLSVTRYIHQNPMKAGIAKDVFESKWTSMSEYIGKNKLVDTELILGIFSDDKDVAVERFKKFMQFHSTAQWMDDEENSKKSDEEVLNLLLAKGLKSISEFQKMERDKRNRMLVEMKRIQGVSIGQLARITGLPKSTIYRAS